MSTPHRGKKVAVEPNDKSPKNIRWSQPYEDTFLDLLVREAKKGNSPDFSFTATDFRNVVADFNRIHGTCIMKKHVLSRIKTMKQHFNRFHGAFNGLSGFSWNHETKMFEAEEYLWKHRIQENLKLERFRDKPCQNCDTLLELYGDTRANSAGAIGLRDKSITIIRGLHFVELCIDSHDINVGTNAPNECSSYGDYNCSKPNVAPSSTQNVRSTQQSRGSNRTEVEGITHICIGIWYNTMAFNIRELSIALVGIWEKVAGSKYDPRQNEEIYAAVDSLGLEEDYKVKCYNYLTANPSKAAHIVGAPSAIRCKLLDTIMKTTGDE